MSISTVIQKQQNGSGNFMYYIAICEFMQSWDFNQPIPTNAYYLTLYHTNIKKRSFTFSHRLYPVAHMILISNSDAYEDKSVQWDAWFDTMSHKYASEMKLEFDKVTMMGIATSICLTTMTCTSIQTGSIDWETPNRL